MIDVAIIGLGLIGGSFAKTIKLRTDWRVWACDLDPHALQLARNAEAIDGELTPQILKRCEMVLVALYPEGIVNWITEHASAFADDTLVVDCGGVKEAIVSRLQSIAKEKNWHYIGGHPMAGREFSGFRYTRDDLFDHASMILTPAADEDPDVVQRAKDFFMDLGFRRIQLTTPEIHDEMIAYTSQLAHIVSSAYVKCPSAAKHKGFSAGSFADMTRVARLNAGMWTELFFDNRKALLPEITGLIERLKAYQKALQDMDRAGMYALLKEGNDIKISLEATDE